MKLRYPKEKDMNVRHELDIKSDEIESVIILNSLIEHFETKIERIMEMFLYGSLELNLKPKEHRRTLQRSKQ